MPRFFFHLREGDVPTDDPEGTDLPDLASARADAIAAARALLAARIVRDGGLCSGHFEICDEAGQILAVVPLRDAIKPL